MMMISKTAAAAAATAAMLLAAPALAADLGRGPPPRHGGPPPYYEDRYPLGIERWTGFYFGATYGYASGSTEVAGSSGAFSFDQDGGVGTLLAGYNWQMANTVVGLEADIGTGNLGGSAIVGGTSISSDINAVGSVRARAGVLFAPQTLLYATAGVAWADFDFSAGGRTVSDTLTGYQIGGGLEYAMAPQWTLRLEYLYTDLGSEKLDHVGLTNTYDPDFHTFRAGVAFKF